MTATAQTVPPSAHDIERAFASAVACHQSGRLEEANALYRTVIGQRPDHVGAYQMLGVLALQTGNFDQGRQIIERALALRPDDPELQLNMGEAYRALGRHEEAEERAAKVLAADPDNAGAHYNIALARRDAGDPEGALAALDAALAILPTYHDALAEKARLLDSLGRAPEAAAARQKTDRLAKFAQGRGLLDRGRVRQALPILEDAAAELPDMPQIHLSLAQCAQALGRFDEAEAHLDRTLDLRPGMTSAHFLRSQARRFADGDPAIAAMEALLDDPAIEGPALADLCFALGKAYDDLDRPTEAFPLFRKANEVKAGLSLFDPDAFAAEVDALIETFTPAFFAERTDWGSPSEQPVFVVGMPRSGTSLVEQIVASHPDAAGAGDLPDLRLVSQALPTIPQQLLVHPRNAVAIDRAGVDTIAARYLEALRDAAGADAARIADKMPLSFRYLGYAALMVRNARVIHCVRDARDIGLSCFMQNFGAQLDFTCRLDHIGACWRQYRRLMEHWRAALPLDILEVRYEDLVDDLEGGARRILDHIGLDWSPGVLDFHRTDRPVAGAAAWQVRQPVHAGSVGRWKRYEAQLAPLLEALGGEY